jgi:heme/copper-type cytochrome/quinol oxidase subunit 3
MEGSASAPTHPSIELEPPEWQPRAIWISGRQLCGVAAFFFAAFLFAYFYLRSLDTNKDWKIGHVNAPVGWGLAIVIVVVLSGVAMHLAARRPELTVSAGAAAEVLALLSIVLQAIAWSTLGFGPSSGGFASVYIGWTAWYAVFTLPCIFWMQTQVATSWRRRKEGVTATEPASAAYVHTDPAVLKAGLDACSFFWWFYVFNGVLLFVVLYLL